VGLDALPERFSDVVDGLAADDVVRWNPAAERWGFDA
jgi:hypothetical protein